MKFIYYEKNEKEKALKLFGGGDLYLSPRFNG